MIADVHAFLTTFTAGSVPTWISTCLLALMAWRGVPGFLNALAKGFELVANRQSQVEERLGKLLDEQGARLGREIDSLRSQHQDCLVRDQRKDERITTLEQEVRELKDENASLRRTWAQAQESTIAVLPGSTVSRHIQDAAERLGRIHSKGGE